MLSNNLIEKSSAHALKHAQSTRVVVHSHDNDQLYVFALHLCQLTHLVAIYQRNHLRMRSNDNNHPTTFVRL